MPQVAAAITRTTDLNGLWRKVQGTLLVLTNVMFDEWDVMKLLQEFDVDWSTREISTPLDVFDEIGVASILEGDYEAVPSSVGTVDAFFTWIMLNARFNISKTARYLDEKQKRAMITSQFEFQGKKKIEAIRRRLADYFYGSSTGVMAAVSSVVSGDNTVTQVIELKDGYGLTAVQDGTYIANLFRNGERLAFIRAGALLGFARVTAIAVVSGACRLTLAFSPAVDVNANDQIVFANSMGNETIDHTDYNKGLTGWADGLYANAIQGVDRSVVPNFRVALADTAAGRFTNVSFRKHKQAIENRGGKLSTAMFDQGVDNDLFDQLQAGVRFADTFGLELDGKVKAKGVSYKTPRRMLPGHVISLGDDAVKKMVLLPDPKQPAWGDGDKIQDKSGHVFSMDYPCQMVHSNPGQVAFSANKARQ